MTNVKNQSFYETKPVLISLNDKDIPANCTKLMLDEGAGDEISSLLIPERLPQATIRKLAEPKEFGTASCDKIIAHKEAVETFPHLGTVRFKLLKSNVIK